MTTAFQAYFRAVEGRWRTHLELRLTDRTRLGVLAPLGRASILSLAAFERLVGAPVLETSVEVRAHDVVHTTRVSKWGVTLFSSVEYLTPDGQLRGTQRTWPLYRARPLGGKVVVTGDSAEYDLVWLGVPMAQHATFDRGSAGGGTRLADRVADTVTLRQETAFSQGTQVLRRVR